MENQIVKNAVSILKSKGIDFSSDNYQSVLTFICDNYQLLGGDQKWYTSSVSLQYLILTGRLNSKSHNFIMSINGNKLLKLVIRIAESKGNAMFSYNQNHFETEWIVKLNKLVN